MSRKDVLNISLPQKHKLNIKNAPHGGFAAGFPPFLRGNCTTMFVENIWNTIKTTDSSDIIEQFSEKNLILIHSENTEETEIAENLLKGFKLIKTEIKNGECIDHVANKIFFLWNAEQNHFRGIAKIRAARMLWAKLIKKFKPKQEESMHLQSVYTTKQKTDINKETINLITAILGGIETITYKNSDAAIQSYLLKETYITKTVDPWAGSIELEKMTEEIATNSWKLIDEKQL